MSCADNVKLCLIQLNTGQCKQTNLSLFEHYLEESVQTGADLILSPEVTNLITGDHQQRLRQAATNQEDEFIALAKRTAKQNGISILLGSLVFKLKNAKKCYNRSFLINSSGQVVDYYDKIHMFDVALDETEIYKESDFYQPGSKLKVIDTGFCKLGMTICYDVRFPHMFTKLALGGANIIAVPSAFTAKTGMKHWEVLLRARAIETGAFIVAPAQTGKHGALDRTSHGHSMVVAPDGTILLNLGAKPGIGCVDINLEESVMFRSRIPNLKNIVSIKK